MLSAQPRSSLLVSHDPLSRGLFQYGIGEDETENCLPGCIREQVASGLVLQCAGFAWNGNCCYLGMQFYTCSTPDHFCMWDAVEKNLLVLNGGTFLTA